MRWMKNSAGGPSTWTDPSAGPARGTTPAARTMRRSGPRKKPRNKRSTAAPEAALRGAAAGCRPVRARRTQSGLHDGWRILRRPRKAAALKLRRRQGRESRPRHGIKGSRRHNPAPARRHPGRPTAASAAGGEMHPAPSAWCALAEGSIWAERPGFLPGETSLAGVVLPRAWRRVSSPGAALLVGTPSAVPQCGRGLYVGRKARHAAGIPCPTSRQHGYQYHPDLEPGKFPRGGPAQGHPHPFRCAGMGVGCAVRERSTYRWDFPRKCLKPRPRWPSWPPGA